MPRSDSPPRLTAEVLEALDRAAPRPLSIREIARRIGLERWDRREMERILKGAAALGQISRVGKGRWRAVAEAEATRRSPGKTQRGAAAMVIEGRYTRARGGFGFVSTSGEDRERLGGDVFLPRGNESDALHGDLVRVEVRRWNASAGRATGQVREVLERVNLHVLGRVESVFRRGRSGGLRFRVVPLDDRLPIVEIAGGQGLAVKDEGRTALVRIHEAPTQRHGLRGEIERLLGDLADPEIQVLALALEAGLRLEFSEPVKRAARRLPHDPTPADFSGRRDLRDMAFVTIDGESARDFDDAVCLEEVSGERTRLRVAIADVAHYVRAGSLLDEEAVARGTSTYFPDRAIPMLPERLSNELCSLMPERDRLVLVVEMTHDRRGARSHVEVYRAVIRSRARLTYTQVAALLSEARSQAIEDDRERLADLLPMLRRMERLMRTLYRRRIRAGSLDLDLPEALVDLSEEGRTVGIRSAARNDAHRMIEEMMLEGNCAVAIFLAKKKIPFPYRIHEPPDPASVDELNQLLQPLGVHIDYEGEVKPGDVQRALEALGGHRLERVLSRYILRSLKQARYATANEGHFGLAFPCYCHFTSPIRRYPDLVVHRQIGRILDGEVEEAMGCAEELRSLADENSAAEQRSVKAERAMLDLKKAEWMLEHLLEEETATIVGIERFGIFVEIDAYPVEGLIHVDDLPGRFRFDAERKSLVASRGGNRFRLGDRVVVEAIDASLERRQVRFVLAEDPGATRPGRRGRG